MPLDFRIIQSLNSLIEEVPYWEMARESFGFPHSITQAVCGEHKYCNIEYGICIEGAGLFNYLVSLTLEGRLVLVMRCC